MNLPKARDIKVEPFAVHGGWRAATTWWVLMRGADGDVVWDREHSFCALPDRVFTAEADCLEAITRLSPPQLAAAFSAEDVPAHMEMRA